MLRPKDINAIKQEKFDRLKRDFSKRVDKKLKKVVRKNPTKIPEIYMWNYHSEDVIRAVLQDYANNGWFKIKYKLYNNHSDLEVVFFQTQEEVDCFFTKHSRNQYENIKSEEKIELDKEKER